ncbi:unnamed protein product [Phytophthora lilii]|uniref:Unnamed protein product n=1 Tax=Phytophthora lilii TaxID=2077276 RepID=A0A9W6TPL2_9STRA|nr:unnamed protein product [Phytophthora lilii]
MLEESGTILERLKLDPKNVFRVIVPYFNGFNPQPVEKSMPIEASFSWRLLFRYFLDNNCEHKFVEWFTGRLPRNGNNLKFYEAINVIEYKLRKTMQSQEALYLFLGIDEYQKIEMVKDSPEDPNTSLLHELVEKIGQFLCSKPSSLILLPMFAGTDLSAIAEGAIVNLSYYVFNCLPKTLLTMDQVLSIAETNANYARLLSNSQMCKKLFLLGGVPRWVVDYLKAVKKTCRNEEPAGSDDINACFTSLWATYVDKYLSSADAPTLVRLAVTREPKEDPFGVKSNRVCQVPSNSLKIVVAQPGARCGNASSCDSVWSPSSSIPCKSSY